MLNLLIFNKFLWILVEIKIIFVKNSNEMEWNGKNYINKKVNCIKSGFGYLKKPWFKII